LISHGGGQCSAMLPIDQRDGTLVVAAPFVGKLGVAKG